MTPAYTLGSGDAKIAAFIRVSLTGRSVAASINQSEYFQSARSIRTLILLFIAASLILTSIAAFVMAKSLTGPL